MTKEEFEKLLPVKIDCKNPEISVKVQKKLFELDFTWPCTDKTIHEDRFPFLFIYKDKFITWESYIQHFLRYDFKEVKPEEILSMHKKEPNYKKYEKLKNYFKNMERN